MKWSLLQRCVKRAYQTQIQLWIYNTSTQKRAPRPDSNSTAQRASPAGNSPRCHHQLLFLSYWPLTGPLPTLNYLISIVLKHPHKLSGALKLSSTVSDMAGGSGGVRRENKQSKCSAFHQSPAVLSFMSPSLQMPQPQPLLPGHWFSYYTPLCIYLFHIFFFKHHWWPTEDGRGPFLMLILSLNLILLSDGFNGG